MLKQVLATLLLVFIFLSQCISADDEYKRLGWTANKHIDDLTDEITSYTVRLDYHKSEPLTFYDLSVECDMQEKELGVTIFGGSAQSWWLMSIAGVGSRSENVTVEYRFNQESVLKRVVMGYSTSEIATQWSSTVRFPKAFWQPCSNTSALTGRSSKSCNTPIHAI